MTESDRPMRPAPHPTAASPRGAMLRRRLAQTSALAGLLTVAPASAQVAPGALPTVPDQYTLVSTTGATMTVTPVSPRTIINWQTYDIGTAATVQYVNPAGVAVVPIAVLNRVTGVPRRGGPTTIGESNILGTLKSADNISVYLVNQAGILFGQNAAVSVGSLIASTRDITDNAFIGGTLRFSAPATAPDSAVLVLNGSQTVTAGSTDPAGFRANAGIVGLIAAKIVTTGTINAAREVALVAANDTTLALSDSGSPLKITIVEGTALSNPMVLRGALNGSSVLVAAATRNSVTDGLLDIQATLTATTAYATDQGIVLAAGRTASLNPNIIMPVPVGSGAPPQYDGAVSLLLGGTLTATGAAGAIDVRARNGITAPAAPATLDAAQAVLVRADAGGVALGDVSAGLVSATDYGVTISAGTGAVSAGAVSAGTAAPTSPGSNGALASVTASAGTVSLGSLFAGQAATLSGTAVTVGSATSEAGTLGVTASAGSITGGALTSAGTLTASATGGDLAVDSATARASDADLIVRATGVHGRAGAAAGAALSAGRDLDLSIGGNARLASAGAGRDATFTAVNIVAGTLSAGTSGAVAAPAGALEVTTAGSLTVGDATSKGDTVFDIGTDVGSTGTIRSTGGAVAIAANGAALATVDAATTLDVTTYAAALGLLNGTAGTAATLSSAGGATVGTLTASRIVVGADGAVTAGSLNATGTGLPGAQRDVRVTGAQVVLNGAQADHDIAVSGSRITLGGNQRANNDAIYSASADSSNASITASASGFTVRADAGGTGAGSIILDAGSAIDLAGVALATGNPAGATVTGNVGIRLADAGAPLTLGSVTTRALRSVDGSYVPAASLTTSGPVTLGATMLRDSFTLTTSGPIVLSSIDVAGAGQQLTINGTSDISTGASASVTASGKLSAANGVLVTAPAAVSLADVDGEAGRADLVSVNGTLRAGAVSGSGVDARARGTLNLGAVASTGTAVLTSATGTIDVAGETRATNNVVVDAPGAITMGDVRSSGATVLFQSSNGTGTGAVTAGNVEAYTDLGVTRAAGLSFLSATSRIGAVSLAASLTEPSSIVSVRDAVSAARSVRVSGYRIALGSVSAGTGFATLTAGSGGIGVSGPILAADVVTLDTPGPIALGDVRSRNATVTVQSNGPGTGVITAGEVRAGTSLSVANAGGLSFRRAIADSGAVSLTSSGGAVAVAQLTSAGTDVTVDGAAVTLGDVVAGSPTTGGAITLIVRTGALSAGALTASNAITVRGPATVSLDGATSTGANIDLGAGTLGVTGDLLAQTDVQAVATGAAALGNVAASDGFIALTAVGSLAAAALTAGDYVSASAGGDLQLASAQSNNSRVTLLTGDIGRIGVTGAITAKNFVSVDAGTSAQIGSVIDTGTAASLLRARNGTLTVGGATSVGGALTASGTGGVAMGAVTSTGGAVTLTSGAVLSADAIDANGALSASGATNVALASARSATSSVTLTSPGAVTVAGLTIGRGDVAVSSTGMGSVGLGDVTSDAGGVALSSVAGTVAGLAISANGALTVTGPAGVRLASARSFGGTATLAASAGPLTVIGPTRAQGDVAITARDAITLGTVTSDAGGVTVASSGAIGATTLSAAQALSVSGSTVGAATIAAGSLDINAGTGGFRIGTATVTGLAMLRSGADGQVGTLNAGTIGVGVAGALTADVLDAGRALTATAATLDVGIATARAGDAALTATAGDLRLGAATASGAVVLTTSGTATVGGAVSAGGSYRVDAASIAIGTAGATTRQAGADVALTARSGVIVVGSGTTIAGTRAVALTARGAGGAITLAPESTLASTAGDVTLATTGAAALGTVTASAGAVRLDATDAALTRALTAQSVTLTNVAASGVTRLGDTAVGNETEFAAPAIRFDLSNGEIGLIAAPSVTVASGARDVVAGAVSLGASTGSTRFAVTANGRIDLLGRFLAPGSTASRTIAIGNDTAANAPRTGVIRLAATQANGGRLLVDGAALELTAERIGGGLDRDFLDAIGYRTATGLSVDQVTRDYVARPTSTLYQPSALGAAPYTDQVLVRSGTLSLTYGRYALFQNTALPGKQNGVIVENTARNGPTLRLSTPGSTSNTFAFFGTIDGINSTAAALLGPDRVALDPSVSPVASRVNGCIIGSGGGCLNTSIAQPTLNLFDTSRAEIVRTADDLTLPFDPLIGTNNEALYLDITQDCEGDQPCPAKP